MKQGPFEHLRCTVSAGVGGHGFLREHHQSGMKIHPSPIRQPEALIPVAPLQGLPGLRVAGVAQEDGGDIGIHVVGAGLDAGHALFVCQKLALLINLLRQVRNAEQIHIFKAVGLPQLCFLGQHIFGVMDIKVHLRRQRKLLFPASGDVKAAAVHVAQPGNRIVSCHDPAPFSSDLPLTGSKRPVLALLQFSTKKRNPKKVGFFRSEHGFCEIVRRKITFHTIYLCFSSCKMA